MHSINELFEWLTVEQTAAHLTGISATPVLAADVVKLALQKEICLSLRFVSGAYLISTDRGDICVPSILNGTKIEHIKSRVDEIDIVMTGGASNFFKSRFQHLTHGPAYEGFGLCPPIQLQALNGSTFQLYESLQPEGPNIAAYYQPAESFPTCSEVVVMATEIKRLAKLITKEIPQKEANHAPNKRTVLQHFQEMKPPVTFPEITMALDPDNQCLNVSARDCSHRVSFQDLGLLRKNKLALNTHGKLFSDILKGARGKVEDRSLSRLSIALRDAFQTSSPPFRCGLPTFRFRVPKYERARSKAEWNSVSSQELTNDSASDPAALFLKAAEQSM
jgi:hypothetical protein